MSVVKVRKRYQLTIPEDVREKLGLEIGDYVEVTVRGGEAVIVPKKLIDKRDAWYWSKEWQEKEQRADEAIKGGQVKEFDNVEDLIKDLNS
jgi:AbrB family looped-hinge helix DNA binding protein